MGRKLRAIIIWGTSNNCGIRRACSQSTHIVCNYQSKILTSISSTLLTSRKPIFSSPYRPSVSRYPFGWICPGPSLARPVEISLMDRVAAAALALVVKLILGEQFPTEPRHFKLGKLAPPAPPPPNERFIRSAFVTKSCSCGELFTGCTSDAVPISGTAEMLSFRARLDPGMLHVLKSKL